MPDRNEIQHVIAAAIANARGGRRGMPPIKNILDLLPAKLQDEVLDEALAVIDALRQIGLAEFGRPS